MADPDAPRPSLAEFTHEVEAAIREAGYQGAFTRDEAQGLIGIEGGGPLSDGASDPLQARGRGQRP